MNSAIQPAPPTPRAELRRRLLAEREQFVTGCGAGSAASTALAGHLRKLIVQLEPDLLGLYWSVRSEFNAASGLVADAGHAKPALALPFTRRNPREMHYRLWAGGRPALVDECGIAATDGAEVVPDVVLAPCVGFTASGFRLGYGGGYFDRWLAAHPHVTAIGVAWSVGLMAASEFAAEPHDRPLALIVTERGVV